MLYIISLLMMMMTMMMIMLVVMMMIMMMVIMMMMMVMMMMMMMMMMVIMMMMTIIMMMMVMMMMMKTCLIICYDIFGFVLKKEIKSSDNIVPVWRVHSFCISGRIRRLGRVGLTQTPRTLRVDLSHHSSLGVPENSSCRTLNRN